jgi:hypothetical protein
MTMDARQYLLDRFVTDAATLRARAASLRGGSPAPGPDAATSERMAEACDRVAALIESVPPNEPPGIMLQSLATLTLPLEELSRKQSDAPAVRSVFAGAATRIRELLEAEAAAARLRDEPRIDPRGSA